MPGKGGKSIGELVSELTQEVRTLFRQELELFTVKMKEKMAISAKDATTIGLGGIVIYFGILVLLATLVLGLATVMPAWGAALLIATVLIVVGFAMVQKGRKELMQVEMNPMENDGNSAGDGEMGANAKITEKRPAAHRLREQIRHTESDITETANTLEQRLSPRYLAKRGARTVKRLAWQGTAKLLDLAQRAPIQASMVLAAALWMLIRNRKGHKRPTKPKMHSTGTETKAAGTGVQNVDRHRSSIRYRRPT